MTILKKSKFLAACGSLMFLAGCSGGFETDMFSSEPEIVIACPKVSVLPYADQITIFREGPGRDLVDVEYEGVIAPVSGECVYEDDYAWVEVDLILRVGAIKGPAAISNEQSFDFFVAVADSDNRVLNKKVFDSPVVVPEGRRRGAVQEELSQRFPIMSGQRGSNYRIIVGFQLSQEQMAYNQAKR
ncbi:MAG: hypothetical protein JJ879_04490 [Sneathiella sp.]|nr:hypothetical protein [Sneathiella sp.]